jgi:hypothetical protein
VDVPLKTGRKNVMTKSLTVPGTHR